ncbi:putative outer membrane protein A [hydrothermal vent metagenome]|uniref:Putative outer membrane protein A n=1 Tax=hydrothermal vent metagenome TaxID=652676 RepID=A0A1W1BGH0_9ZZZZ
MKKITLSLITALTLGTLAMAGGDLRVPIFVPDQPIPEAPADTFVEESVVAPADDGTGFYVGVGYSFLNVERSIDEYGTDNTYYEGTGEFESVMLQAGYKVNQYIGVEGRYWVGLDQQKWSTISDNRVQSTGGIDAYGLFAKPMYPVTEDLDVYALIGYGSVNYDISYDYSGTFDGVAWGFGASYEFSSKVAVFADYTSIYNDTTDSPMSYLDDTMDFVNVGVGYRF